jgi:nitrogen-specific signal transduction histidine kinase
LVAPRGEASGPGLDIVRRIIERHGSKIQVYGQPGRTTFTVQLPLPTLESKVQK